MRGIAMLWLCMALSACATPQQFSLPSYVPTRMEVETADYGPPPVNYEPTIKAYLQNILKDPESARYRFTDPPSKSYRSFGTTPDRVRYYWLVNAKINAKNSYGGYIGEQTWWFHFRDGQIIEHGSYGP